MEASLLFGSKLPGVTYNGHRVGDGWEIVVKRPGQPLRLLDLPLRKGEWALTMLTDYLGDEGRAADLHHDFAALTIRRFTADWELSASEIDNALLEVEILKWCENSHLLKRFQRRRTRPRHLIIRSTIYDIREADGKHFVVMEL